jgi:hypothetical protein
MVTMIEKGMILNHGEVSKWYCWIDIINKPIGKGNE